MRNASHKPPRSSRRSIDDHDDGIGLVSGSEGANICQAMRLSDGQERVKGGLKLGKIGDALLHQHVILHLQYSLSSEKRRYSAALLSKMPEFHLYSINHGVFQAREIRLSRVIDE